MASPFKLSVCPHDTAKNLLGWFTLNTYVQRNLGIGIHFEPQDNFLVERQEVLDNSFHLVYANPYSALCFAREKGFVPVARPSGVNDETLVVARAGAVVPDAPRIASATTSSVGRACGSISPHPERCSDGIGRCGLIFRRSPLWERRKSRRFSRTLGKPFRA